MASSGGQRLIVLALAALAVALAPAGGGHGTFIKARVDAATKALRSRDFVAAEAAWLAVLELDPRNLQALEGLVAVAGKQGSPDAEAVWLRELNGVLADRLAAGEVKWERDWKASEERLAELDPALHEGRDLLSEHGAAMAGLGAGYLEQGFHARALTCWIARLAGVAPGSPEAAEARAQIARCLAEGGDYLAGLNIAPELGDEGRDAEWIAAFDQRTAKFSQAGEWKTAHYRIKVAGNWRLGQATARVMEQVGAFYRDVWGLLPDPPPANPPPGLRDVAITPIALNIYATHAEFVKRSGSPDWAGGVFLGSEVATYDHGAGGGTWRETLPTLFHEASHQFMAEAVGDVPSFVNEGIACQFESIEILPNGTIRRDAPNKQYLAALVQELKGDGGFSLATVMDPLHDNRPEFYAPRWGLFHFLRMFVDDQGAYVFRPALDGYLYSFKRGSPADPVKHLEEHVIAPAGLPGMAGFADFERVWREWILALDRSLKDRDGRLTLFRDKARMAAFRDEPLAARSFWERAFDLEPDDPEVLAGLAAAAETTGQRDRAAWLVRRWLDVTEADDPGRAEQQARLQRVDPLAGEVTLAERSLVGGMAGLAQRHDRDGRPLLAMAMAHEVLAIDPFEPAARALVTRLERETGRSLVRWQQLFNGVDLEGWFGAGAGEGGAFLVRGGTLTADYSRVPAGETAEDAAVALYQTLFVDRNFDGDWAMEARIATGREWEIAGICFGARDAEHFEGVVLRRGHDGSNRVDFGSFDGTWSFRGDGSYKAAYDPAAQGGTLLRVDVRRREVSVTIDGVPLPLVVGGKPATSIRYPMLALRGNAGLLASKGVTRFTDLRLLAGRTR